MLTVDSLLEDCGLELAVAAERGDNPVRWVHISEHEDPTPWLSGGELLLTTGYNLGTPAKQRRYVELLAGEGLAGLGFGIGFDHKRMPKAILETAAAHDLPLFEVPYEMPFIAITERAASKLVNEQFDALERGAQVHERLERLVIEGGGLEQILAATGSRDRRRRERRRPHRGPSSPGATRHDAAPTMSARCASSPASLPATDTGCGAGRARERSAHGPRTRGPGARAGAAGVAVAWLIAVSERDPLGDFERLCIRQAAIVVGLELMRERVVRETERRLAGDLLADALGERLGTDELSGRLRPFGIGGEAAVLIFDLDDPPAAERQLESALADAGVPGAGRDQRRRRAAAALRGRRRPRRRSGRARPAAPARRSPAARAATASASPPAAPPASARCAAPFTRRAARSRRPRSPTASAPDVASHRDLGAFTLLLALQDDDALRLYSDGLLDPIEQTEGEYGGELLRSLEAFIENNGNWERAARQLYCHRHTLRYRIRKIEELTGRDLGRATDRIELWLALRARELR